jgi:hypothetical protein
MDVSNIAAVASQISQQRTAQAVDVAVMKKAIALQSQNVMTLISSVTPASSLPAHLGQNVNVVA